MTPFFAKINTCSEAPLVGLRLQVLLLNYMISCYRALMHTYAISSQLHPGQEYQVWPLQESG